MRCGFQTVKSSVVTPRARRFQASGEPQFEDGIVAERVGVVSIFIACGNLKHALFEQVFWGKVDTTRIARVRQHGCESTGEPQLIINVFE